MNKHIKNIQQQIRRVKNEMHEISEAVLSKKIRPEKWSKKEIFGHLIDSARYNLMRFNEVLAFEKTVYFQNYPQDALVKLNDYQTQNMATLVFQWQVLNTQICHTLAQITEEKGEKELVIAGKTRTLEWLISDYVEHLKYHLAQIFDVEKNAKIALNYHFSIKKAVEKLATVPTEFVKLLEFGDLEVEYYQPNKIDKQTPHKRDELYVIAAGSSSFVRENEIYHVETNDVLFVKAGETHKFIDFTDDFATWVVFYGLER